MSETSERQQRHGRHTQRLGTSIRQTETDRNRHACRIGHCAWDHAKNTSLEKELQIERETLRARLRDTHMEKETEIEHKRKRERHREEKTEKYQAHLVEATRKSPRSSKTVMKRTASLRFAALAPQ